MSTVRPGLVKKDYIKLSSKKGVGHYKKTAHYDKQGKLRGITDRTSHNQGHPNPHHHRWNKKGSRVPNPKASDPQKGKYVWPGEFEGFFAKLFS